MSRTLYLIDGVAVPRKVYYRRMVWGEHAQACFTTVVYKQQEAAPWR